MNYLYVVMHNNYIPFFISVNKLAQEQIAPVVRDMEKAGKFSKPIVDMLFENGV